MKKHFLHDGNKEHGSYSVEDLKGMNLKPCDMVWCEGMDQWEKASDITEIKEILPVVVVPPPLTPASAPAPPPLKTQAADAGNDDREKKKS